MQLRRLFQPMMNELDKALEQIEKQAIQDGLKVHEHVHGWFLLKLESRIKRFINEQERFYHD